MKDGNRKNRSLQTMNILKVCILLNPLETKKILKKIYKIDSKILKLSKELSDKMNKNDIDTIKKIEQARATNNKNWMDLIRLAFEVAPEKAKRIMTEINAQDAIVTELLEKLSSGEENEVD